MPTTRFAPSPTGALHLGHAYSALFAAHAAESGGRFLLRIEDIDIGRCNPKYISEIETDLAWLGLQWEVPVRRQSRHLPEYKAAVEELAASGLAYPCFCTRADIAAEIARAPSAPHGPDGPRYPGTCRKITKTDADERISAGTPHAWRLDVRKATPRATNLNFHDQDAGLVTADPSLFGDVVIARKDTPTSYHLAVTIDDAAQGIDLVTRGEDLRAATHVHRLLQALLGLPVPAYRFHRLLTGPDGKRFAKRDKSRTLRSLRENGATREAIKTIIGWTD